MSEQQFHAEVMDAQWLAALRIALSYDPATGLFFWPVGNGNNVPAGTEAGSLDAQGYQIIRFKGCIYKAHRLAWVLVTGEWPALSIDHINGLRSDNRWCNLRQATAAINSQNVRTPRSKTGFLGVARARGGYTASIQISGKSKYLGYFKTAQEASHRYLEAKRLLHEGCTI